jgi:2-polyprenyl-6-methoxyphenol hydroxylase-like FAD-dependent oxidoreductase
MTNDVLIIGGGPGGAATAMFLVREGMKPIMLDFAAFLRQVSSQKLF